MTFLLNFFEFEKTSRKRRKMTFLLRKLTEKWLNLGKRKSSIQFLSSWSLLFLFFKRRSQFKVFERQRFFSHQKFFSFLTWKNEAIAQISYRRKNKREINFGFSSKKFRRNTSGWEKNLNVWIVKKNFFCENFWKKTWEKVFMWNSRKD